MRSQSVDNFGDVIRLNGRPVRNHSGHEIDQFTASVIPGCGNNQNHLRQSPLLSPSHEDQIQITQK